jgi:ADP-ribose pyrophosphatase YjhB (NUDIX family)
VGVAGRILDDGEEPSAAAAREVEEETGWRPRGMEFVLSCQQPEVDETAEVRWVAVEETSAMIAKGDILGAMTIIGVQHVLLRRAGVHVPPLRSPGPPERPRTGEAYARGHARSGHCGQRRDGR